MSAAGLFACFDNEDQLLRARKMLRENRKLSIETYTAHEISEDDDWGKQEWFQVGDERSGLSSGASKISSDSAAPENEINPLGFATLLGAIIGGLGMFLLQWFSATESTPLWIGGKPLNSWPAFVPVTFVSSILGAAMALAATFFVRLRFPRPWHPVFEAHAYDLSREPYSLLISEPDSRLTAESVETLVLKLKDLGAHQIEVLA